jgi:hypothetical protein
VTQDNAAVFAASRQSRAAVAQSAWHGKMSCASTPRGWTGLACGGRPKPTRSRGPNAQAGSVKVASTASAKSIVPLFPII